MKFSYTNEFLQWNNTASENKIMITFHYIHDGTRSLAFQKGTQMQSYIFAHCCRQLNGPKRKIKSNVKKYATNRTRNHSKWDKNAASGFPFHTAGLYHQPFQFRFSFLKLTPIPPMPPQHIGTVL